MILSSLRIEWISEQKGYGLFATKKIPKGCITFVQDSLDLVISPAQFMSYSSSMKNIVDRYSYETATNDRVLSWDLGKYMNHCCFANTLTTGYGFEIAIRDIEVGEEVTDDYRIFTTDHPMEMQCSNPKCGTLDVPPLEYWDRMVKSAISEYPKVSQELDVYLTSETKKEMQNFLKGESGYISVATQFPRKQNFIEE